MNSIKNMKVVKVGDKIPFIQFKTTNNLTTNFDQFHGKWLVLYFYPKDATPGCTKEACDFRDYDKEFAFLNSKVLGVSRDSIESHGKFKTKENLPFELISDVDESLCQLFDVIRAKSMYGKTVRGIERSTFLIDPNGLLQQEWRKVKVQGHVENVLSILKSVVSAIIAKT